MHSNVLFAIARLKARVAREASQTADDKTFHNEIEYSIIVIPTT